MNEKTDIKVLLVLPFFYPHRGGSQKYAEELYATLLLHHNDVKVDVLCYNTDKVSEYEEYRNFRIFRIPCWNVIPARFALPNPVALVKTLSILSKNRYDFVNTHIRFFDPTWWLWFYAKLAGSISIFTGHVATHPIHQNKFVEITAKIVDLTIATITLRFYNYLTATNKTAIDFFKQKLHVSKEINLVYGGVDTTFFSPTDKQNRVIPKVSLKISDDIIIVTYVGRLIWTKGVTYLYEAAKNILNTKEFENKVVFIIAGPGELENQLINKARQDRLENKILFTGNLSYTQVKDLLAISDVFINPSHHNEGFPNTVLEAGSAGCFVIATDNAGTWEVVKNKETGLLIPQKNSKEIENSIIWALKNPEDRKNIANNFRQELTKKFDWVQISNQYYNMLIKWRKKV